MQPIRPDWPAPPTVHALVTTRQGGVSLPPWDSLNAGDHVADDPAHVAENRRRIAEAAGVPADRIYWLKQVHGVNVVRLPAPAGSEGDASLATEPGRVCAMMTADCLPVLFCTLDGRRVAAAHAGWRGLCDGVLEQTVAALAAPGDEVMAWLGPAIGPQAFEVGAEVRDAFLKVELEAAAAFAPAARSGHYLCDLYLLARQRLAAVGVHQVYGGGLCTWTDAQRFYSFRRDGATGRMASLIWLA
ncbi:MAG: peptidoglycan editing factor PgeF [Marinobacter sp.]|nr:peptidoglycan editing factor PgeF [Marinobacter sp.]